jgi:hypothetical protein
MQLDAGLCEFEGEEVAVEGFHEEFGRAFEDGLADAVKIGLVAIDDDNGLLLTKAHALHQALRGHGLIHNNKIRQRVIAGNHRLVFTRQGSAGEPHADEQGFDLSALYSACFNQHTIYHHSPLQPINLDKFQTRPERVLTPLG